MASGDRPAPALFDGTERFEITSQLGEGGMGVVYAALDREQGSKVALKTLRHLSPDEVSGLKREFRSLQDLQHPNVVTFGELFEESGQWFFTMELVEGVDFVRYVRPTKKTFDEARLRSALGDLTRALVALHDAEVVHRDIKPKNILVTKDGRPVLMDFGLAGHAVELQPGTGRHVLGSANYMAPEQGTSAPIGAPADMYAIGVILYQALTGRVPLSGEPREVLRTKQRFKPIPPSVSTQGVPKDLDQLCVKLLAGEPAKRPTARDVLAALSIQPDDDSSAPSVVSPATAPFIGRRLELDALIAAFDLARRSARAVFIVGPSGIGKSSLVRQFVTEAAEQRSGCVILSGRCYERESVSYKAFDDILEGLTSYMLRLSEARLQSLIPRHARELTKLFPILRQIPAFSDEGSGAVPLDRREGRDRAFGALRDLFGKLTEYGPMVVMIDDLHWADDESIALLTELLRPPNSPPMLWVSTLNEIRPELEKLVSSGDAIALKPLSPSEAAELASELLARTGCDSAVSANVLAQEGQGHPLFIDQLVHHASSHTGSTSTPVKIEDALRARVEKLEESARRVLRLVCVAGAPVSQEAVARALGTSSADFTKLMSRLRTAHLIRTVGAKTTDPLVAYHNRIREAVLDDLDTPATIELHEALARGLEEAGEQDHDALAIHWMISGAAEKAASYAFLAAEQAMESFAFDRAARLYLQALHSNPGGSEGLWELQAKLGEALANCGHGAESAAAYIAAAADAPAAEMMRFQHQAGVQYLMCGHISEGMDTFEQVLEHVGLSIPKSKIGSLLSLLYRRARVRLRGVKFKERDQSEIDPTRLQKMDLMWSVSRGLGTVNPIVGSDIAARYLLEALDAGDPHSVALAISAEAAFSATRGTFGKRRTKELLGIADRLAEQSGQPLALGITVGATALAAFLQGRFRVSLELTAHAERIFREECTQATWELNTCHIFDMIGLMHLGEIAEAQNRHPVYLRNARERGDLYLETCLQIGQPNFLYLARGQVDEARRARRQAMQFWTVEGFTVQHFWDLISRVQTDLFLGDGDAAWSRVKEAWPQMRREMLFRVQAVRVEALILSARAAVAAADERRNLTPALRAAEKAARKLAKERDHPVRELSRLIMACVAASRGNAELAVRRLESAEAALIEADLNLYATGARRRRGQLLGGDEGAVLVARANEWMADQGITAIEEVTQVVCPGFTRILR